MPNKNDEREKQLAAILNYLERLDYPSRRLLIREQQPQLPRFLYKFRALVASDVKSVDRMRDILVRSRFWLSSPLDFNDPFDMSAKLIAEGSAKEKRERVIESLMVKGLSWIEARKQAPRIVARPDSEFAELSQAAFRNYVQQAGVYSFGGAPLNILMWSHYASNHEGVCLRFEVARDIRTFAQTINITYSSQYPVVNWIKDFREGIQTVIETKHEGWVYEKETRILVPDAAHTFLPFRPEALRAIIIGCRASDTTTKQLRELIAERLSCSFPRPMLYRASKHDSKYRLVLKKEPW